MQNALAGARRLSLIAIALWAMPAAASITGKVTDAQTGNPLQAMVVAAFDLSGGQSPVAAVTSDPKGRYSINVQPGTYRVLAYDNLGTYATMFYGDAESFETTSTIGSDASDVNFALRRAGVVTGTVAWSGSASGGITVAAYNLDGTRRGFTPANPIGGYNLVLPAGNYKIAAYDNGGALWPKFFSDEINFADATIVSVAATQTVATAFHLEAAAHVFGTVVDDDTKLPLNAMRVAAYDLEGVFIAETSTDANGAFDLKAPSGTFRVVAYDPRQTYATAYYGGVSFSSATNLALGAGETRNNIRVPMWRAGMISGQVTDSGGSPLVVTVAAYGSDGTLRSSQQTGSTGTFNLLLAPGDYKIAAYDNRLVYATQFYWLQKSFAAGNTIALTSGFAPTPLRLFVLDRGSRISGVITDSDSGAPVSGIAISAYDTNNAVLSTATSSANGDYDMVLPAGTYRFVAYDNSLRYATAFAGGATYETSATFTEVAPSNDRVDFRITRGMRVTGSVTTPTGAGVSGIEVSALDAQGNHAGSAVSKDGIFDLVLLPNSYRFVAVDPQARYGIAYSKSTVTVTAGSPVPSVIITVTTTQRRHSVGH